MSAVEQIEVRIGYQVHELAASARQRRRRERSPVLQVEDDELLGEGSQEDVPPPRGEAEPREVEGEDHESGGGR